LVSKCNPPYLCLPSKLDYRHEPPYPVISSSILNFLLFLKYLTILYFKKSVFVPQIVSSSYSCILLGLSTEFLISFIGLPLRLLGFFVVSNCLLKFLLIPWIAFLISLNYLSVSSGISWSFLTIIFLYSLLGNYFISFFGGVSYLKVIVLLWRHHVRFIFNVPSLCSLIFVHLVDQFPFETLQCGFHGKRLSGGNVF
jgi:hypothetical protein